MKRATLINALISFVFAFSVYALFSIEISIASETRTIQYDTITTEIISLAVGSNGRFGCADSTGMGGVTMDFFYFSPECDTVDSIPGNTRKYIFDGSIFIGGVFGTDTILSNAIYGGGVDASSKIYELSPPTGPILDKEIEHWTSGTLTNFDSSIAFRVKYFAPRTTVTYDFDNGYIWHENRQIITKELKVWSHDGLDHEGITVGEVIDWDIPSDSGVKNSGGVDTLRNLLYCVGAEFNQDDEIECQDNDQRYGGMSFGYFKRYVSDSDTLAWFVLDSIPYGGYHEANARYVAPSWDDNQLYQNVSGANALKPWSHEHADSQYVNLHSVLIYVFDYDLKAGDTLVFYTVMFSVRNAAAESLPSNVVRIQELTEIGQNYVKYFGCCNELRGDLNTDGIDGGLLDMSFLINYAFQSGPAPTCLGEADVNADGYPGNLMDISFLVDYIFRGKRPPYSCGEPPCDFSNCHDY